MVSASNPTLWKNDLEQLSAHATITHYCDLR
ncbi:hypothetical protein RSAG8_01262, partial [Rhizoctonia solani AG-8 WAC10335]